MIPGCPVTYFLHPVLECLAVCRQRNLLCVKKEKKRNRIFVRLDICMRSWLGVVRRVLTSEGRFQSGSASPRPHGPRLQEQLRSAEQTGTQKTRRRLQRLLTVESGF